MQTNVQNTRQGIVGGRNYTNVALTAIGVLLGVIALNMSGAAPRTADAQVGVVGGHPVEEPQDGLISGAEQRKTTNVELRQINEKLERIQSALERGLNVRVTSMPASEKQAEKPSDK